jgi:hypothetical protein
MKKTSESIVVDLAEIRTGHFPNTSQKHYHLSLLARLGSFASLLRVQEVDGVLNPEQSLVNTGSWKYVPLLKLTCV